MPYDVGDLASAGLGSGLPPACWQAISWTNADSNAQILVKFKAKWEKKYVFDNVTKLTATLYRPQMC